MATNGNPVIARQCWPLLAGILVLSVLANIYIGWLPAIILLLLLAVVAWLYRDPRRTVPSAPLAVVSPASGRVIATESVLDPWLERQARKCRIRMSFWDVHSLRSPIEGKVMDQWSSEPQEPGIKRRYTYWIRTDEGDDIIMSLAMGKLAPIFRMTMQCGDRIGQGQPCGFLYFTGLVDVYTPEATKLEVEVNDGVESGTAIIGRLLHNQSVSSAVA